MQKVSGSRVPGVAEKKQAIFAAISPAMGHGSVAFILSKYATFVPNHGDTAVGLDEALGEPPEVILTRSAMFSSQHGKPPAGIVNRASGRTNATGSGVSIAERPELSLHKWWILKYATASGARAKFSFTGNQVAWVASTGANRGKAEVWVDGAKAATVDLYAPTAQPRKMVFSKAWATSPSTNHTLEVRALGTKNAASSGKRVDVDAFVALR